MLNKDFIGTLRNYLGMGSPVQKLPITNIDALRDFIQSRSSHISQTTLFGYMKTRAGTRFPEMFSDPGMLASINMAKWQVFSSCMSDLSIYAGGLIKSNSNVSDEDIIGILCTVNKRVFDELGIPDEAAEEFPDSIDALFIRIRNTSYATIGDGESAFVSSPDTLYKWAPIAKELKVRDKIIVKNSIRFKWKDIRIEMRELMDVPALISSVPTTESVSD